MAGIEIAVDVGYTASVEVEFRFVEVVEVVFERERER